MNTEETIKYNMMKKKLRELARTLEGWVRESEKGGWPTHHSRPQMDEAAKIKALLFDIDDK